jgi:hypothetical protein
MTGPLCSGALETPSSHWFFSVTESSGQEGGLVIGQAIPSLVIIISRAKPDGCPVGLLCMWLGWCLRRGAGMSSSFGPTGPPDRRRTC